jgi:hypothetical protein
VKKKTRREKKIKRINYIIDPDPISEPSPSTHFYRNPKPKQENPAPFRSKKAEDLSLSTPDTLQISIALRKTVKRVVGLAASAHKSAERIDAVLAGVAAVLVNVADGDLHGGVVVGFDDAVGSAAFAGDVAIIFFC